MSRDAFIGELRHRMAGLPQDAVERTVEYYSELIADSMEDGLSETEARPGCRRPKRRAAPAGSSPC